MACETRPLEEFVQIVKDHGYDTELEDQESNAGEGDATRPGECFVCEQGFGEQGTTLRCYHDGCGMRSHTVCLADHFVAMKDPGDAARNTNSIWPERGGCPSCGCELHWPLLTSQATAGPLTVPASDPATARLRKRKRGRAVDLQEPRKSHNIEQSKAIETGNAFSIAPQFQDDFNWFESNVAMHWEDDESSSNSESQTGHQTQVVQAHVIDLTVDEED